MSERWHGATLTCTCGDRVKVVYVAEAEAAMKDHYVATGHDAFGVKGTLRLNATPAPS